MTTKAFAIVIGLVGFTSVMYALVWFTYIYPKNYEYNLRLADDASTPEDKAKYLKAYLNDIATIQGEPRWIFKRPDVDKQKQIEITEGLVKRLDDIAQMSPSDLAYQQGLEQITGQELDHQLERISSIFRSAKLRENPLIALSIMYGWILIVIAAAVFIKDLE